MDPILDIMLDLTDGIFLPNVLPHVLLANKVWGDRRLVVPVLMSASVDSISFIIRSVPSLLISPACLLGVEKRLVGNLSLACPESDTPM